MFVSQQLYHERRVLNIKQYCVCLGNVQYLCGHINYFFLLQTNKVIKVIYHRLNYLTQYVYIHAAF